MISTATPVMKPTISELGMKRISLPNLRKPAISMMKPVNSESAKRVPGESPLVTAGTLAITSAMALVVCTLR